MNRIYSAAISFNEAQLTPFLRSAALHLRDVEINLLVDAGDISSLQGLCSRYPAVRLIGLTMPSQPQLALQWAKQHLLGQARTLAKTERNSLAGPAWEEALQSLNPALSRYFIIERALAALPTSSENDRIMLCDSRDLVFQRDAFAELEGELVTGAEPGTVGKRDRWIGMVYGEESQRRLHRKQVICSGFTVGSKAGIQHYVKTLCDELWSRFPQVIFHRGLDQAVHIRLFHDQVLKAKVWQNFQGRIATIALEASDLITVEKSTGLVQVHGLVPSVLHQYDRHPELVRHIESLFPSP